MSVLNFSVDFSLQTMQGMQAALLKEFVVHMDNAIIKAVPVITQNTEQMVANALRNSPTWNSLQSGELRELLALENVESTLFQLERNIVAGMSLIRQPVASSGIFVNGGFRIGLLNDSYSEALTASQISYSTINGFQVTWMEWLLFYGTSVVMRNRRLISTPRGVVAAPADSDLAIPGQFSGIAEDNFLTRALQPIEPLIGAMIETEVSRRT